MITVRGFDPGEGLWWERVGAGEGLVCLELVGVDKTRWNAYRTAIETLAKETGLGEGQIAERIWKGRLLAEDFWRTVYGTYWLPRTDVEGLEKP